MHFIHLCIRLSQYRNALDEDLPWATESRVSAWFDWVRAPNYQSTVLADPSATDNASYRPSLLYLSIRSLPPLFKHSALQSTFAS